MHDLSRLLRLADLLLVAAGILRTCSKTNAATGAISAESTLAMRLEAIAEEVAALYRQKH